MNDSLIKSLMRIKSRIPSRNVDRIDEINRRILEIISQNKRSLLRAPIESGEWWKNVDYISQRRRTSANVNLDRNSLMELNDYFANLCQDTSYVAPTPMEICEDVNAPEISEIQVWNNLRHMKKSATGPDLIPYWVWKEHAEIMTPIIHKIWNLSLRSSIWPSSWKRANVNPLPLPLSMQHEIYRFLDNPNCKAVRFFTMDFSKAFDSVRHELLSCKHKSLPLSHTFLIGI